jgi:hypothetical protein
MDSIKDMIPEGVQDEYRKKIKESSIYRVGKDIYPVSFDLKEGIEGSEIQLKFTDCIAVVQDLLDQARKEDLMDGYRKIQLIALIGSLDEMCYRIDPVENKLLSLSPNQTHLRKNRMAIYSNASKLISLEREINGETDSEKFFRTLKSLPKKDQLTLIKTFMLPYFEAEWITELEDNIIEEVLELIIKDKDLEVTLSPEMMVELFNKFKSTRRVKFLKYLSLNLNGNEMNVLRGITKKNKEG